MHDIWNPWHGCKKCSEGCENCYMYFLDRQRDRNGAEIYRTKAGFSYPLQKEKSGGYMDVHLTDRFGLPLSESERYTPFFGTMCENCGSHLICNGCSRCEKCASL